MGVFLCLSGIALRQVVGGVLQPFNLDKGVDAAIDFLTQRFTNHSLKLIKALQSANEQAWKALEVALAGDSLWERCKKAMASADDKALAEQVRTFLEESPLNKVKAEYRPLLRQALQELRSARSRGALAGSSLPPTQLAREAFARFSDPQALLDAEWKVLSRIAEELRETCPNLTRVLCTKLNPPLLAVAVRYYFRRQVETDQELFQGLVIAKVDTLQAAQERAFEALNEALSKQGQILAEQIAGLDERIERLEHQIQKLLDALQIQNREVRPCDSLSIRSDAERLLVRQVVERFRSLPEAQRSELPGLINNLGKLQVAAGDFEPAQRDFADAAAKLEDPRRRAEAHHNAYQAALERQQWAEALAALQQAAALYPARFAPFPFDRYDPKCILGAGGFGVVFLCQHQYTNKPVVIKSLQPSELERDVAAVFAEATALEDLDHPAIIKLRDCGFADADRTRPYLAMDYFEGTNLADYVATRGPLSPEDMLAIARPAAEALQAAHAKGILHRDVKPANLLVRRDGSGWKVKLIDFGLALRPCSLKDKASTHASQANTTIGRSIAGTLHYAAPEQMGQAPGVSVRAYSDVYGFGKTCYYALLTDPEPGYEEMNGLHEKWRSLLSKCSRKDSAKRLPDFAAVLEELVGIEKGMQEAMKAKRAANPETVAERLDKPSQKTNKEPEAQLKLVANSLGMKFAWIPPGAFLMGSPPDEPKRDDEETQHRVTLTSGFWIGVHPVTQAQWQAVMDANPSRFKGDFLPVEQISWEDAVAFSEALGRKDGKTYRLPTEAEWEYACRAGTTTPFHFGATLSTEQANYDGNNPYIGRKKGVYREKTTPVGSFPANVWGLYDMHGNVYEWCQDWHGGPYPAFDLTDPKGSDSGESRVMRGGCWYNIPAYCRSAARDVDAPGARNDGVGCRVVLCLE